MLPLKTTSAQTTPACAIVSAGILQAGSGVAQHSKVQHSTAQRSTTKPLCFLQVNASQLCTAEPLLSNRAPCCRQCTGVFLQRLLLVSAQQCRAAMCGLLPWGGPVPAKRLPGMPPWLAARPPASLPGGATHPCPSRCIHSHNLVFPAHLLPCRWSDAFEASWTFTDDENDWPCVGNKARYVGLTCRADRIIAM